MVMRTNRFIDCLIYRSVKGSPVTDDDIRQMVICVLKKMGKQGSLSIHLVGEKKIRTLNKTYRGKDRPTDVLSFGMEDAAETINKERRDFGDIFLCLPYIRRQALSFEVPFVEEIKRMLIHGILHLLGYDHEKRQDAVKMFSLQEYYLSECV